ncbi:hypothetical protein SARC_15840, partial [Sphaeroforma arctica JP610]
MAIAGSSDLVSPDMHDVAVERTRVMADVDMVQAVDPIGIVRGLEDGGITEDPILSAKRRAAEHHHLTKPVKSIKDKWTLLPAFLKVKGLVSHHINSYNYFVDVEMRKIMRANQVIRSAASSNFYFK